MPTFYGGSTTWYQWIDTTTSSSATETWTSWTTTGGTATNVTVISANAAWTTWNSDISGYAVTPGVITPEQAARFEEERQQIAERAAKAEAERKTARDRARALLMAMLNVKQREQFEREHFFEVVSQKGNRYRLRNFTHGNVELLDKNGKAVMRYCGQPLNVPIEDAILAQKLQLEYDEAGYVHRANGTRM